MAQLEYRLFDEKEGYPALFNYQTIPEEEIMVRFLCDYFIKDDTVFEKTSNAIEPPLYVIYVKFAEDETPIIKNPCSNVALGFIVIEVREFSEEYDEYPIIKNLEFTSLTELAIFAQCNYIMLDGFEWEQTSLELDEDRHTYVLYVKKISSS
jgi:hypothetical protein